ncbi:MAG: ATP-binding protein [Gemmatimonadales bacterium]
MTFRTRLTLAFAVGALVPLAGFGFGVRREMAIRLDRQSYDREVAVTRQLRRTLDAEMAATQARLTGLATELSADNRFRVATVAGGDRTWLLDWARGAMITAGFAALQVQDSAGQILSSGHFPNDFDRRSPSVPGFVAANGGAVVRFRTPEGAVTARVGLVTFGVAGRTFTLLGGPLLDSTRVAALAPGAELAALLVVGDTVTPANTAAMTPLQFVDEADDRVVPATIFTISDPGPREQLARQVDRWFLAALGLTLLLVGSLSAWLAGRISQPLADLAAKTERLDLERLDQQFATDRDDEIGALAGLLDAMTRRLRAGAQRLRESERRATVGDLARQVNHDVKNGLAPIRHVVRHLGQVAETEPGQLAAVFQERRETLESSIEYLDVLARNYAKLSPPATGGTADLNRLLEELAGHVDREGITVVTRLMPSVPRIAADPVVLRRIFENLLANAVEAIESGRGTVTLATEASGAGVRAMVTDDGRGMSREELDRAFDDFFTTKGHGTGLGLSVVRRLVADLGGSVRAQTEPGRGTTFIVELPGG